MFLLAIIIIHLQAPGPNPNALPFVRYPDSPMRYSVHFSSVTEFMFRGIHAVLNIKYDGSADACYIFVLVYFHFSIHCLSRV